MFDQQNKPNVILNLNPEFELDQQQIFNDKY